MNPSREVVITGLGVVSSIGIGHEAYWQSLLAGKSGVGVREQFADSDLPHRIAAPVRDFDAKQFVKPRKALKIMCAPIQFGCAAAAMAAEQAGIDRDTVEADRMGTIFGTETFFADPNEVADVFRKCTIDQDYQHDRWGEFAMREIQPLWMLKYLPNMAASHISIAFDARGPSNSICQGEVSGLLALIEAADLIKRNAVDVVIAGGTGSQMALTAMLYRGTSLLSKRVGEPEKACRPFDLNRDGMVAGEGSGALILESADHARARGAKPLATLAGWSRSFQNANSPEFSNAISDNYRSALNHAGMSASDIGLVNANASGSIVGDAVEGQAIEEVFGQTPVVAHKSNFGNMGPGTSIVELIGAVLAGGSSICPPTLNCESIDPNCNVNVVT
ncbi:MAG: 3-oxoacyl-[acyl-carrier-protein] synthase II, partial [Mariniblastus sp.]